jgi:peptidoglycan biosynthesis protein MviN/MurJ (putative lipid II flippase)
MKRFSIIRAAATTGAATLMSRILGFLRDVMIAASLGAGPLADIFVVAFRLPNLFRRLFAEGAFNAAFVPIFAKRMEAEGVDAARKLSAEVLAALLVGLIIFTLLAEWYMPYLVHALAGWISGYTRKIRFGSNLFAHNVSLSGFHVAIVALCGDVERLGPICRRRICALFYLMLCLLVLWCWRP